MNFDFFLINLMSAFHHCDNIPNQLKKRKGLFWVAVSAHGQFIAFVPVVRLCLIVKAQAEETLLTSWQPGNKEKER
jgi:hypothetical protein